MRTLYFSISSLVKCLTLSNSDFSCLSLIAINTIYVINSLRDNVNRLEANRIKENKFNNK